MNKGKIMLNLGVGERERIPGFTNVDIRPLPNVDIVAPVDNLDMFQDDSVEVVYASHVLEHFPRRDTQRVLREWYRVLKPKGTLRLSVPDFEAVIKAYEMTKNLALVLGHLVGGQDYPGNTHYMVFDFAYLSTLLSEVGFRCIRKWDWKKLSRYPDDQSRNYFPHKDFDHGILMSLNVECEK